MKKSEVKKVIQELIKPYTNGECYETKNPYIRPYVVEGLKFLQREFYPEVKDWLDIDRKF